MVAGALLLLGARLAVTPAAAIVEVAEVQAKLHEWNGRTVDVHGWIKRCERKGGCAISGRADSSDIVLMIGEPARSDRGYAKLVGSEVVLRAIVTDGCLPEYHPDDICLDSTYRELIPVRIARVGGR